LDDFDQALIKIIGDEHPETLEEAVNLVSLKFHEGKETIMERVLRLESEGKISFEKQSASVPSSLTEYFLSSRARWFWIVFSLAVLASIMVFVVPEDSFPLVYARYVFSLLLIPNIMIDEYERLLGASDLTLRETWHYEGALQWWTLTSVTVFTPLAVLLIIVNVSILFLIALAHRRYQSQ